MGRKIFNIGLNRAGTTSLTAALTALGFLAVHHEHRGIRLYDIMVRNIRARRPLLFGLDDEYDVFSDFAGHNFFTELDHQYPGSKFILTTRELTAWLDSRARTVNRNLKQSDYRYSFRTVDREQWTRDREQYIARLHAHFHGRERDLLVMDIPAGEGWEKLCAFLELEPPEGPFPFRNHSPETDGLPQAAGVTAPENSVR